MAHKVCVIYDSHIWNDFVSLNLSRFSGAASGLCDFFAAYHCKPGDSSPFVDANTVLFTDSDVFDHVNHTKYGDRKVVPGNWDLSLLAICKKIPGYDTYIRIEYDVLSIVDPRESLGRLVDSAAGRDLGGSFFSQDYGTDWKWWPGLQVPGFAPPSLGRIAQRAFFPIMSVSQEFTRIYEEALAAGWRGHGEALAPTIAKYFNCTIVDFARLDQPLTRYPQFQVSEPQEVANARCAFVHPVKTIAGYEKIRSLCPDMAL